MNYFFSPLDQFEVLPIYSLQFSFLDLSITNINIILALIFLFLISTYYQIISLKSFVLFLGPNNPALIFNNIYNFVKDIVVNNIGLEGSRFFPFVLTIFIFIVSLNVIGLIPYSYTITSHLIVTFAIATFVFLGINIITAQRHGVKMFSLFLPAGTSLGLAFLLVPIELISYIFKPVSLSIRLFVNMMAGHTLLKVIAGFAYTMMGLTGFLFLLHYIPLLILIPLFVLEFGISIIQSFVFSVLISIYLNDAINLH